MGPVETTRTELQHLAGKEEIIQTRRGAPFLQAGSAGSQPLWKTMGGKKEEEGEACF